MSQPGVGVIWCRKCGPIMAAVGIRTNDQLEPHHITHVAGGLFDRSAGDAIVCPTCHAILTTPGCVAWLPPVWRPTGRRR